MSVFSKIYENAMKDIKDCELRKNEQTSIFINNIASTTVISSFKYKGDIPEMIKQIPDFIEENLFYFGKMGATINDEGEFVILPVTRNGNLLRNGLSSQYTFYYRNGETFIRNIEDMELIYDNWSEIPSLVFTTEIIEKMTNALRAVDCALERSKVPPIIASQKEELVGIITEALNNAYANKNPFAVASISSALISEIEKISLYDDREQGIINLWDIFVRYKNLFFTTNGINNVEIAKQERLTMAEGSANTEITRYGVFYDKYDHRIDAMERIEKHFGKKITVEINRNRDTVVDLQLDNKEKFELEKQIISPYKEEKEVEEENNNGNEDEIN